MYTPVSKFLDKQEVIRRRNNALVVVISALLGILLAAAFLEMWNAAKSENEVNV